MSNYKTQNDEELEEETGPSKSQIKQEMRELQELGQQLVELSSEQLDSFELDDQLRDSIDLMKRTTKNEAKRRLLQYIGKLMRNVDPEPIRTRFDELQQQSKQAVHLHHSAERWRDRLLDSDDKAALNAFIDEFPHTDIQSLRQLIRNAAKEKQNNKPPSSARKLFKLVRETLEA